MSAPAWFALGFVVGGALGVLALALLFMTREVSHESR